jgi:DNA helicase-2/ATP-dependent DNA helicase PcrA
VERILSCLEPGGGIPAALERALELLPGKAAKALKGFVDLYDSFMEDMEGRGLSDFVTRVIQESGLEEYHRTRDEVTGRQKLQNLEELVNAAGPYPPGGAGLAGFLENIELDAARVEESKNAAGGAGTEAVTLITMHNTKGLEFERVIITGLEDGLFPKDAPYRDASRADGRDSLEEERRLFYVAITRARRELYFTFCSRRRLHGQVQTYPPSRFLQELPEDIQKSALRTAGTYPPPGVPAFQPGTTVYHEEYGQGIVFKSAIKEGAHVVTIRFDSGQVREFLPKYERRLERVESDGL